MKIQKLISPLVVFMLFLALSFTASNAFAQTKTTTKTKTTKVSSTMKDGYMMKDGKMMQMEDGKMMPMDKDMTMKNGTKVMTNGDCMMKDGKTMKMKEGQFMDMNGMMHSGNMMHKTSKNTTEMKSNMNHMAMYVCPMHPEVTSDKPGKCSKCGMDMVEKK